MKYASSISKGGLLVSASSVDHQDFACLGLTCVYCSNPVFLNAGRQFKGSKKRKSYKTEAYFCHFKGVDKSECELRSQKEGEENYQRSLSVARNQRLKKFQQGIMTIFRFNPRFDNFEVTELCSYCNTVRASKSWTSFVKKEAAAIAREKLLLKHKVESYLEQGLRSCFDDDFYYGKLKYLEYLATSNFEWSQHRLICSEVVDYLTSSQGRSSLESLVKTTVYESAWLNEALKYYGEQVAPRVLSGGIFSLGEFHEYQKLYSKKYDYRDVDLVMKAANIAVAIGNTPWAKGFEYLRDRSLEDRFLNIGGLTVISNINSRTIGISTMGIFSQSYTNDTDNLADWWQLARLESSSAEKISRVLPNLMAEVRVVAHLVPPENSFDGYNSLYLYDARDICLGSCQFWLKRNDSKHIKKMAKAFDRHVGQKIAGSPSLEIISSLSAEINSLMLALVAAYYKAEPPTLMLRLSCRDRSRMGYE